MPPRRAVELRVGGQTYRVVATDDDRHVQHLAELVDRKFSDVVPQGRGVTPQQAIFLTALALADEVEELRARAARLEAERDQAARLTVRAREAVTRLLARVDNALSPIPPVVSGAATEGTNKNHSIPAGVPRAEGGLWGEGRTERAAEGPEAGSDPLMDPPDALNEPMMFDLRSPKPAQDGSEAAVPRTPRGGLRLVRRSTPSDDDSR